MTTNSNSKSSGCTVLKYLWHGLPQTDLNMKFVIFQVPHYVSSLLSLGFMSFCSIAEWSAEWGKAVRVIPLQVRFFFSWSSVRVCRDPQECL